MNGVCVICKGWLDLERLEGIACLEYDQERGAIEEALLREHVERYKLRMREFEERHGIYHKTLLNKVEEAETVSIYKMKQNLSIFLLFKHLLYI